MNTITELLNTKGRDIVTIHPAETVQTAAKLMADKKIGALVVRDHRGHLVGILSERDIVRVLATKGTSGLKLRVQELMTKDVKTCRASDSIKSLMQMMTMRRHRHVPVCNEAGDLNGVVSMGDLVKARLDQQAREIDVLRELSRARA